MRFEGVGAWPGWALGEGAIDPGMRNIDWSFVFAAGIPLATLTSALVGVLNGNPFRAELGRGLVLAIVAFVLVRSAAALVERLSAPEDLP